MKDTTVNEDSDCRVVRVVDGIVFSLPSATRDGAEAARITLTDLAAALGYADKDSLRRLAGRNSQEISEFGETATVTVSLEMPNGGVKWLSEPTYNPDQCILLGLASQTEARNPNERVWQ